MRAVEPLEGVEVMRELREAGRAGKAHTGRSGKEQAERARKHPLKLRDLTNGPGKVCAALGIDKELYGHELTVEPLVLEFAPLLPRETIGRSPRVGISKNIDAQKRFFIEGNEFVSRA